jgi:hypothetical protein
MDEAIVDDNKGMKSKGRMEHTEDIFYVIVSQIHVSECHVMKIIYVQSPRGLINGFLQGFIGNVICDGLR